MVFFRFQDCGLEWFSRWKGAEKLLQPTIEYIFRHVTFGAVGTHGDDAFPGPQLFCNLQSSRDVGAATGTGKHTFVTRELAHHGESGGIVDHHDLVRILAIKSLGNET